MPIIHIHSPEQSIPYSLDAPFDNPHAVDRIIEDLYDQRAQITVRRSLTNINVTPYCLPEGSRGAQFILGVYENGETGYIDQHYLRNGNGTSGYAAVQSQDKPGSGQPPRGSSRHELGPDAVFPLAFRFSEQNIYHIGGLVMQVPGQYIGKYTLRFPIGE